MELIKSGPSLSGDGPVLSFKNHIEKENTTRILT